MGMNTNTVLFVLGAHRQGVKFDRSLTVGRLEMNVYRKPLRRMLIQAGVFNEDIFREIPCDGAVTYADPVFRMLGARELHVLDVSNYEGADVLHDLNQPIPDRLKSRFDVICDGGTLEHIFNLPVALTNYMDMLAPGGSLFLHLPANNVCGHGFYQISPDLLFRALCPENGFRVERLIMHADGPYNRWYQVADPRDVKQRVELISWRPMHLLAHAIKTRETGCPRILPQQISYESSDYRAAPDQLARRLAFRRAVARWVDRFPAVSQGLRVLKHGALFYAKHSLCNRRLYRPVPKFPPL